MAHVPVTRIQPPRGWLNLDLAAIWRYRELLYFLTWRSIKVRYKQAVIGVGWVILQPLLTVGIFTAIFGVLARMPSDGVPYPVFALAALVPWMFFAQAITRGGTSLVGDAGLLTKVYFPRLLIPLSACSTGLLDVLLSFVALVVLMGWYDIAITWRVLTVPLFGALTWVTAVAVSLWTAPLNVRYRDVAYALPFLTQIWMYGSPVVYPVSLIPEQWRSLYGLNPLVGIIEGFRWALLGLPSPDWRIIGVSTLTIGAVLLGGLVFFRRMETSFADIV